MKNYSEITASAQTDFDYTVGFVKSVLTSDFRHLITVSPAKIRGLESGYIENPTPDFTFGFLGFLPLKADFESSVQNTTVEPAESGTFFSKSCCI